jgi:phage gpG-like protein
MARDIRGRFISGSFDALRTLIRKVEGLGELGGPAQTECAQMVAEGVRREIDVGFEREMDPYDAPWAPLGHRDGKILQDTGRMAASYSARAVAGAVIVESHVEYTVYHQHPSEGAQAHGAVQRMMLPEGEVGDRFGGAINREASAFMEDYLQRGQ